MRSRYERSLKLAVDAAQIADRAYFIDNSQDIQRSTDTIHPSPIFRTVDGTVKKVYMNKSNFPEWCRNIYNSLIKNL